MKGGINLDSIEEIKRMQSENRAGWSKHLTSYCKIFFDAEYSLKYTQKRLLELHDLYVGVDTLRVVRKNYLKEKEKNLPPTKEAKSTTPILPVSKTSAEIKMELNTTPNQQKKLSKEEKDKIFEEAAKAMEEAERRAAYPRTDFDEYLERQQVKKNSLNNTD